MSSCALASVHQTLKRCFQILEQKQTLWNTTLTECTPLLSSLGNLAEQLGAVQRLQINGTPLKDFPDLRERLRFKLLQAVDTVFEKLNEKMGVLQSLRDAVSNQASDAFQVYTQHADALDLDTCVRRSASCPSLADMLEWMQDADQYYQREFLRRKVLLQTLKPDHLGELQTAPMRWETLANCSRDDNITEMLCRVTFFRDSQ